jgi:hypothetical protein
MGVHNIMQRVNMEGRKNNIARTRSRQSGRQDRYLGKENVYVHQNKAKCKQKLHYQPYPEEFRVRKQQTHHA